MRKPESTVGTCGWVGLAAYVVAWDFTMPESLTHSFERGMDHKIGRFALVGAGVYTFAHLIGDIIPRQYDLFYQILELHNERQVANND